MKLFFITTAFLLGLTALTTQGKAYQKNDILQNLTDQKDIGKMLLAPEEWVPFPKYNNRASWQHMTNPATETIIKRGEKALMHRWKVVTATYYLEFDRSGNREIMQKPFNANIKALANLTLAELAEGKGRFIAQIVNGVWHACEMTSWSLSAHMAVGQKPNTALPAPDEHVIDLTAGDVASLLSWIHYFLKEELDKVSPLVSKRLEDNIRKRILQPYMERNDYWWQAFNATPETMVNNWNPWCNFNVLTSFLLIEKDKDLLAKAVYRTMVSVDKFLDYSKYDGACEEDPSYWGHAAGKLYDFLQILDYATGESIPVFGNPMIRNMGEYIVKSYIGDGWVVNFADASAKGGGLEGVIYRYGEALESKQMQSFASYLYQRDEGKNYLFAGRDIFRTLENLLTLPSIIETEPSLSFDPHIWYPQTEFCYIRQPEGLFFAGKGGFNAESHNHNDVGTFVLYHDCEPVFVDAGVETYTRKTFSSERYSIRTMQSNYHNLPIINGCAQKFGKEYKSSQAVFKPDESIFSVNIARAYPEEASINNWIRSYQVVSDKKFLITDDFELHQASTPNQVNFMTALKPIISGSGKISIPLDKNTAIFRFDPEKFRATVDTVKLSDPRLTKIWGSALYRLSFTANQLTEKNKY